MSKFIKCATCQGATFVLVTTENVDIDAQANGDITVQKQRREVCDDCCGTGRDFSVDEGDSSKNIKRIARSNYA